MRMCECTHYEDEHSEGSACAGCGCTNFREYVKPRDAGKSDRAKRYEEAASDKSLLPCPFCGHKTIIKTGTRSGVDCGECASCSALAPYEMWNKRATSDMLEALVVLENAARDPIDAGMLNHARAIARATIAKVRN